MASAHSFPEKETPTAGEKLASPPSEVVIDFDAPIEKLFAKLEVTGPDGQNLAVGSPQVSDDGIRLSVKVGALKPGDYLVKWAVVCIDTHHTKVRTPSRSQAGDRESPANIRMAAGGVADC